MAAKKKSFDIAPAELFFTGTPIEEEPEPVAQEEPAKQPAPEPVLQIDPALIPEGYRLAPEKKTVRKQIVLSPTMARHFDAALKKNQERSFNDAVCKAIQAYIDATEHCEICESLKAEEPGIR